MREKILILVVVFIVTISIKIQTVQSVVAFSTPSNRSSKGQEWILEMEEIDNQRYENIYEPADPKIFTEKRGGSLIPQDAREWIKPEETKHLLPLIELDGLTIEEKIEAVYRFVKENFRYDPVEESDFWQYPAETIKRGAGDCEDLAFLVKSLLLAAGIPDEMAFVNIKYWHVYTTITINGETKVLEFDPDETRYYGYDWPKYRFNLSNFEQRKRKR